MKNIRQTQFKRQSIWPFIFKSIKGVKLRNYFKMKELKRHDK